MEIVFRAGALPYVVGSGGPAVLGLSLVIWLLIGGLLVLYLLLRRQTYLAERGGEPLVDPSLLSNRQLTSASTVLEI